MKTNAKFTRKITATVAAFTLAFLALICLFSSGCSFTIKYDYIKYDGEEGYYVVRGSGQPYTLNGTLEIPATYGEGDKQAPVKEIAVEAFRGCAITKVIIPASITKIGVAAFANCLSLTEVEFEEGSALEEIPQGTFALDARLREINLPRSVQTIGYCAFLNCEKLATVTLSENLKTITARAFEGCSALSKITFPQGLESIGSLAFYNCGLTEVIIPDSVHDTEIAVTDKDGNPGTKTVYGLDDGAFHTCRALKKAVVGSGLTVIKPGVFGYCDGLEEIYIPASVIKIEGLYKSGNNIVGHAFHNCISLKTINYAGNEEEWEKIDINNEESSINGSTFNNNALFKDKNGNLKFNYNTIFTA